MDVFSLYSELNRSSSLKIMQLQLCLGGQLSAGNKGDELVPVIGQLI